MLGVAWWMLSGLWILSGTCSIDVGCYSIGVWLDVSGNRGARCCRWLGWYCWLLLYET